MSEFAKIVITIRKYIMKTIMFKEVLFFAAVMALGHTFELNQITRDGAYNKYIAYTANDRIMGEEVIDTATIKAKLVPEQPVVIMVHGTDGSSQDKFNTMIRSEIFKNQPVNVIAVDWSAYASRGYANAVAAVPSVGIALADFIREVEKADFLLNQIQLIGFDLGAHVCGFAGRGLVEGRKTISKITGLNPNGLYWGVNSGHLSKDDALVVEVIHTDIFQNGIGNPIGDIDIYINRGRNQPGCSTHLCSHNRSYEIMAASISNANLKASQCNTLTDVDRNTCRGPIQPVGSLDVWKMGVGIFRANTGNSFPF